MACSQYAQGQSPPRGSSAKRRKLSQVGAPSRSATAAVAIGDAHAAREVLLGHAAGGGGPHLPGRLTFWALAGAVGSSPVGEGRNPALGDLLVSTLVHCSGEGPISTPFDPFLSSLCFSPGDLLGQQVMTHWGLWAMAATVLTCAPLMEITLNLVGPHLCDVNTCLVDFVVALADYRGALGAQVHIVRRASSVGCPVDPVSQSPLDDRLWEKSAGPVLRPLSAVESPPATWEEWVWNSSHFGLDSPSLPGFPVKLPRPSLDDGGHPSLASYFDGVPSLSLVAGRLSTFPDWRGFVHRYRGCPVLVVHVSAKVVKGDPSIFEVGVVLNGTCGLRLRVHTLDGTEAFPLLPLAPLLDWVCLWAGGLLI